MGSTRRFSGQRLHSSMPLGAKDTGKILAFDPSRRAAAKQSVLPPKRPNRPTAPKSTIARVIWNAIAALFGISRGRRSRARGAEPSGKRRA